MKEYRELVAESIKNQSKEVIVNSDIHHATILIEQMFLNANNNIRLISNLLDERLFSKKNVVDAIKKFLEKDNTKLEILIETDVQKTHPLFDVLKNFASQVMIKKVMKKLLKKYPYNFITMDDNGYRFESDRKYHKAIAEYGNIEDTKRLNEAFYSIFNQSEDYQWL